MPRQISSNPRKCINAWTWPCIHLRVCFVLVNLSMGVLDMNMRICLCKHVKAYVYYVKEKKSNIEVIFIH